jgi:hypothetical protein
MPEPPVPVVVAPALPELVVVDPPPAPLVVLPVVVLPVVVLPVVLLPVVDVPPEPPDPPDVVSSPVVRDVPPEVSLHA